ncbi:MAG: type II secretion system F family protein [Actinomycetota bacterium]
MRVLGVSLVGIGAAAVLGPFMLFTLIGVWAMLRRLRPVLAERRRRAEMRAALPDTVDVLVLMIRSGLTPHLAMRAMARRAPAPTRDGFDAVVRRLDRGTVLADALDALVEVTGPAYAWVADALTASERHGTPLAPVLDQLALEARRRRRADAEAHARTLPVRLSFPLVVCILPAFVLVAIAPAVMAALSSLGSPPW